MRIVHKTILNRNVFDSIAILAFQLQWHNCDDRISKAEPWLWFAFACMRIGRCQCIPFSVESLIRSSCWWMLIYLCTHSRPQRGLCRCGYSSADGWNMISLHTNALLSPRVSIQHMDEALTGSSESWKCLEHDSTASLSHAVLIGMPCFMLFMFMFMSPVCSYWTGLEWVYGQLCVVGAEKRSH